MTDSLSHPLSAEFDHWNDVISLRYHQFLVALTDLKLATARQHLKIFDSLLNAFAEESDSTLGNINIEDPDALQMVRADHLILGRSAASVSELLNELESLAASSNASPAQMRAHMVDRLDGFIRLYNILGRHQQRKRETVFPLYAAQIDHDSARKFANALTKRMQQAIPD